MARTAVMRPMTEADRAPVHALARCTFPVASAPKRFARDLAGQAVGTGAISEPQAAHLRRLVSRYRRQIRSADLPESERWLLTDWAARKARTEERLDTWTALAAKPQTVPSWVVRATGMSSKDAIVAKWGAGATFQREDSRTLAARPKPPAPPPPEPPKAADPQLSLGVQ